MFSCGKQETKQEQENRLLREKVNALGKRLDRYKVATRANVDKICSQMDRDYAELKERIKFVEKDKKKDDSGVVGDDST